MVRITKQKYACRDAAECFRVTFVLVTVKLFTLLCVVCRRELSAIASRHALVVDSAREQYVPFAAIAGRMGRSDGLRTCAGVLTKIRSSPIAASAGDKTGRDARQDLRVKQSFDCRACLRLRPGSYRK